MTRPFNVNVTDYGKAQAAKDCVKVGHHFVFVEEARALGTPRGLDNRMARLLVKKSEEAAGKVLPLLDKPIELAGLTIVPESQTIDPIGCVVTDRDLYRAEQDTVHLFVALPVPPEGLRLIIECNGELLTERDLELDKGVGIETLSMLLPGSYTAQLAIGERRIGIPASFTVAEYTLAPLSGRLVSHELKRELGRLSFDLAVESYQVPYTGRLRVALVDPAGHEATFTTLEPRAPGRYAGDITMPDGGGPFRFRLTSTEDAERVAEVAIPGTRKAERDYSVVSELGQEMLFSMMPEPGALPVRGGYLSEGDFLATPLMVKEIVTREPHIHVNADVEGLVLVELNLASGHHHVRKVGDVKKGQKINISTSGPMSTVFVGCMIGGQPFEGYTTFITPSLLQVAIEAPETVRPREDLVVRLSTKGVDGAVPVLLCVRDERLTATDTPEGRSIGADCPVVRIRRVSAGASSFHPVKGGASTRSFPTPRSSGRCSFEP